MIFEMEFNSELRENMSNIISFLKKYQNSQPTDFSFQAILLNERVWL